MLRAYVFIYVYSRIIDIHSVTSVPFVEGYYNRPGWHKAFNFAELGWSGIAEFSGHRVGAVMIYTILLY